MTTQTDLRLNIPAPAVSPGSRVRIAPHMAGTRAYADARGYTGIVQSLSEGYTTFARVCFDRGEFMPPLEKDVAAAHLIVIPADSETPKRATRRAPSLRLTEPQDTRNEAARQAEAVKFFTNLTPPYFVHEIGGKRRGYKCHSRVWRRESVQRRHGTAIPLPVVRPGVHHAGDDLAHGTYPVQAAAEGERAMTPAVTSAAPCRDLFSGVRRLGFGDYVSTGREANGSRDALRCGVLSHSGFDNRRAVAPCGSSDSRAEFQRLACQADTDCFGFYFRSSHAFSIRESWRGGQIHREKPCIVYIRNVILYIRYVTLYQTLCRGVWLRNCP